MSDKTTRQVVRDAVLSSGGMRMAEIAKAAFRGIDATLVHLRALRAAGEISAVRVGNQRIWMGMSAAAAYSAEHAVKMYALRMESSSVERRAERKALVRLRAQLKRDAIADSGCDEFVRPSRQSSISAATAPRLALQAANSVWQWGQA